MIRPALALTLAALALGLTACGDDDPAPATTAPPPDRVRVVIEGEPRGVPVDSDTLCADGPALCAAVRRVMDVDPDEVCTEIYGGPDVMTITGTLDGARIAVRVTRTNGCEISRYESMLAALDAQYPGG